LGLVGALAVNFITSSHRTFKPKVQISANPALSFAQQSSRARDFNISEWTVPPYRETKARLIVRVWWNALKVRFDFVRGRDGVVTEVVAFGLIGTRAMCVGMDKRIAVSFAELLVNQIACGRNDADQNSPIRPCDAIAVHASTPGALQAKQIIGSEVALNGTLMGTCCGD
jgi:hypothetical protein